MRIEKKHNTIFIGRNTVTKTASPKLMRVEVEKTRRAFEIGKRSGLFRVPEVYDFDETAGTAVFERLHGIDPVKRVINGPGRHEALMDRIGRVLAVIHDELSLPDDMVVLLPPELDLPGTEVFLHGDFNAANVFVERVSKLIVVLDCQMTSRHGGKATYGSRYFDVIWFVNYLLWSPTWRYLVNDPASPVINAFIETYLREADKSGEKSRLSEYSKRFFSVKRPKREEHASWRQILLMPRSDLLTKKFLLSLVGEKNESVEMDYRSSHTRSGKGKSYHAAFSKNLYRQMVWQMEQEIIDGICREHYGQRKIHHLDFACGTGRVLHHLESRVETSVGVDLSPTMLEVAKKNNKRSEIIEADLTERDVLGDRKFNLITAFRFFPNAQQELRTKALAILVRHLSEDGLFIFNNHKNTGSVRNKIAIALGRGYEIGMSHDYIQRFVGSAELEIVSFFPLSIFPSSEGKVLLPISVLRRLDKTLGNLKLLRQRGDNIIYVCRKKRPDDSQGGG